MTLTVDGADAMDLDYTNNNGRLTEIADAAGPTFSYSYLASSNLIETLVHNNGTTDILTTTRTYDDADRLLSISSSSLTPETRNLTSFTYTLDATGRRIARTDLDGTRIDYAYNARDELTGAVRSGYPTDKPYGDYPYDYGYGFDRIGNHLKQTKNGTVTNGRYNNLNQLLEREVAGAVRVQGTADGVLPIGVKVDGNAAATAGIDADTTAFQGDSSPIQPGQTGDKAISIVATDSAEPPKKTESTRTVRLPAANPVAFTYDLNGNMLSLPAPSGGGAGE